MTKNMPRFCLDLHGNPSVQYFSHWGKICQYSWEQFPVSPVWCFRTNT